jgi:hypothetical protein
MNAISSRVPAEFTGMARKLFYDVLAEEEVSIDAFNRIMKPAHARLMRHPLRKFRDGEFRHICDAWGAIDQRYQLAFAATSDARGRCGKITDIRMCAASHTAKAWGPDARELSLIISVFTLEVPLKRKMSKPSQTIASISLHALARRFQRVVDRSHKALINDCQALITANVFDVKKYPTGKDFRIETPNGYWLGMLDGVRMDERLEFQFVVRTFIDKDA